MELILANFSGKTRRVTLNGREYIVAPMTSIVRGVLNGSQGALYYPDSETSRNVQAWDGMPLTNGHPSNNGRNVSARSPEMFAQHQIGHVYNSSFSDGKLTHEGWFDVELTRAADRRFSTGILNKLERGEPIELSTGLFTENELAPLGATFNGKPYQYVARNYRPDHIAVLPNQVGACSRTDGCGVMVNQKCDACGREPAQNAEGEPTAEEAGVIKRFLSWLTNAGVNQPRHLENGKYLEHGAGTGKGEPHAAAVAGKNGVCTNCGGVLNAKGVCENCAAAAAASTGVEGSVTNSLGGEDMSNKAEIVQYLTTNCDCWKGAEKTLNSLDEEQLKKLKANAETGAVYKQAAETLQLVANSAGAPKDISLNAIPAFIKKKMAKNEGEEVMEGEVDAEGNPIKKAPPVVPAPAANQAKVPTTLAEFEALMPPEAKAIWNTAKQITDNEKARVVAALVANCKDPSARKAAADVYNRVDLEQLRPLLAAVPQPQQQVQNSNQPAFTNFFGAAPAADLGTNRDSAADDILEIPTVNWAERVKARA